MKNSASPGKPNLTLWLIGGVYLLYSAWRLLSQFFLDPDRTGVKWVFPAIALLFAAIGLWLVLSSLRRVHTEQSTPPETDESAAPSDGTKDL